jgi:hypothetical protein
MRLRRATLRAGHSSTVSQSLVRGKRALQIWKRRALTYPQGARGHILICLANLAASYEALGDHAQARHYAHRAAAL